MKLTKSPNNCQQVIDRLSQSAYARTEIISKMRSRALSMNSTLRLVSPYSARQLYRNGGSILTRSRVYLRQWSVLILYQSQKLELFWPHSPFHSMIATRDPRDKSLILPPFGACPRVRQVAETRMKSARIRPPRDTAGTTRIESDRPEANMGVDTYNCKKYGQ